MGLNDLLDYADDLERVQKQSSDVAGAMLSAHGTNPDQYAKYKKLELQTGKPAQWMVEDPAIATASQREVDLDGKKWEMMSAHAPRSAAFLAAGDNARLAHDDVDNMSGIERAFDVVSKSLRSLSASPFSASQGLWSIPRGAGDLLQMATKPLAEAAGLPDLGGALADWAAGWQRFEERTAKGVRGNTEGAGLGERALYSGMESLGQNLLTLPLTIASGGSTAPMLTSMSLSSGGQAYGQARDKGKAVGASLNFAASQGLIEYATEKIPALKFVDGLKLKTGFGKFAKQMIGSEIRGEQVATLTQDLNEWAVLNPEKPFSDYLKERPSAAAETLIATIVGAGGQVAVAKGLEKVGYSVDRYVAGKHNRELMLALGDSAKASKLRERMPEKYRELIGQIKEGGDVENVYVPAEDWKTYFQEQGIDPEQMAADTMDGGSAQYAEALAAGGDIVIPLEVYAEKLAASDHHTALMETSRLRPGDMTAKESAEFEENREQITADILDQLQAEALDAEVNRPSHLQVYDDIFGQLQKIGYDRGTAERLATLEAARAKQRAAVLGVDAFDLYNESPLKITKPLPEALQRQTVDMGLDPLLDRLRTADVPTDDTIFGQSLLQFLRVKGIKDSGGELVSRDANLATKKPGQKNLVRKDGLPLDKAREAAAEAGYLPDESTIADFLDLIDGELRGTAAYSSRPADETALNMKLTLDQLQGELDKRGVDLAQMDNETVRQQLFGGDVKRGYFRMSETLSTREIAILEDANMSTFIHELSHSWFEELKRDASRPDAPEQLKQDWETVKAWAKIEGEEIPEESHEQFARGGEAYVMEGKAPSAELRPVFQRFKSWLVQIYKTLKGLNVTLNDDVRGVFDRLLASEEEIKVARQAQGMVDLFLTAEEAGMTEAGFKAYRKQAERAHVEEVAKLDKELMDELSREKKAWWEEAREAMRIVVEDEAQSEPVYRAIRLMSTGKMFDGTEGEVLKLSREDLVRMYGEPFLKRLPRGFHHIYSKEGGVHPDVAAELFGFESGDEMVRAMIEAPLIGEWVDAETDIRMRETYGDMLLDGTVAEEAQVAIHNERRADVVRAELKAIRRQQAAVKPVMDAAKEEDRAGRAAMQESIPPREAFELAAAQAIGVKKIGEIDPKLYLAAERRAAKAAFQAVSKKDWQAAGQAKYQELLNHYLYREALRAKEQVDGILKQYDALKKSDDKLAKGRDMNMVNAARAILAQYGIDKNGMHAAEYMALISEYSPESYADLQAAVDAAAQRPKDWKQLTMDEFLTVNDAVMNLWELSRRTKQLEIDGRMVDRDMVISELSARVEEIGLPKNRAGYNKAVTKWEGFKASLVGIKAAATRVEAWVEAMDAGDKSGPFRRYIWQPIVEGIDRYRLAKKEYIIKYLDLVKQIEGTLTHDKIAAPEFGYTFNGKQELLGALLHTGNRSNLEKLLIGRGWAYEAEDGGLDTEAWDTFTRRMWSEGKLTEADYTFIQGVWDLFEEVKPLSQKAHHEMYGYYFSEITHDAFQTPWGEFRGGYAPAVSDSAINQDQAMRQEKEALESVNNSFMFPSTGRGFTKGRVKYNKPLVLDLRLVPSHLDKVLRFSFIEPRVKDVGRLLINRDFREVLGQFDASAVNDMLVPWLQRSARQTVEGPTVGADGRAWATVFRVLRRNSGMQMMVANVANTLQQFTGLAVSNTVVDRKHLTSALFRYVKGPRTMADDVASKSVMMQTRVMQSAYDMQQQAEDILLNPDSYEKFKDFSIKNGYILQQITQHTVDVVTWAGAYDQALAKGEDDREAVRQADSAVRMTQGSFNAEDVSKIETGHPFVRAFTQFYTYFNMLANLLGGQATAAVRQMGWAGASPRLFFLYFMGFAVPAILSEGLMMLARGGGDPDDDETDMLLQLLVGSQLRTGVAMVPVAGQGLNYMANLMNKKRYDDRISTAPFITSLEAAGRAPFSIYKYANDEGSLKMAVKDTLTAIGMATSTPAGALGRPLGYLAGIEDGAYEPEDGLDMARGLITGYPTRQ